MSARIRQFLITICEWLHAAMVLAPLAGVLYMLLKERNDSYIPVMYAIALGLLLPANMILRTAVMRAKSLWLYLIVTAAVLTGVFAAAASLSGAYFEGTVRIYLWVVLTVQTVILAVDCFGIRMEDNRRRQAVLENDPDWRENVHLTQRPGIGGGVWFALLYILGVLVNCSSMCDIAFRSEAAYLVILVVYQFLTSTEQYLRNRHDISHVPEKRIRRISTAVLAVFLLVMGASILLSAFAGRWRRYADLRQTDNKPVDIVLDPEMFEVPQQEGMGGQEDLMAMLAEDAPEPWIGWEYLAWIVAGVSVVLIAVGIFYAIRRIFAEFRNRPEENGDIAVRLEPEDETVSLETASTHRTLFLTEEEKIRKRYRKMIRKNRKDRPGASETPEDMEKLAGISELAETKELHALYEKVRYGR